jgi:hypothetical protein
LDDVALAGHIPPFGRDAGAGGETVEHFARNAVAPPAW